MFVHYDQKLAGLKFIAHFTASLVVSIVRKCNVISLNLDDVGQNSGGMTNRDLPTCVPAGALKAPVLQLFIVLIA